MNDVVFVMANSKLAKNKQARKGVELTLDDIPSDDEWIVEKNNDGVVIGDNLDDDPNGDDDDFLREVLGEDIGHDPVDDLNGDEEEENEDETPLEDDYQDFNVDLLLN